MDKRCKRRLLGASGYLYECQLEAGHDGDHNDNRPGYPGALKWFDLDGGKDAEARQVFTGQAKEG